MRALKPHGSAAASIEVRSIDYVPDEERHGGLLSQFTLWLAANLQITAIVTGALAVVFGGDVFWSLIGLLVGQLIGGAVMALHAAQGPQLGLPQMISCRVQFGVYGAIIPMVAVCLMYIGFSASGCVLAGQALSQLLGVGDGVAICLFSVCIVVVTLFGYRFIHFVGRLSSVVGIAAFSYMFYRLFAGHDISTLLAERHFSLSKFLLAISLSASWQIAFGPYVADYSRYLPRDTSASGVFAAVGLGSVIGSQISMSFGVLAAALAGKQFEHHEVAYIVGLGASGAAASLLYFSIAFGKVTVTSLNAYGSFMSMATIVSGFRRGLRISVWHRFFYVLAMIGISVRARAHRPSLLPEGVRVLHPVPARGVYPVERDQSGRLLLLHACALRRAGLVRPRWALRQVECNRYHNLPGGHPRADPVPLDLVLHRAAGGAAWRCRRLVDSRFARAGRSVLCSRTGLAPTRPRAADPTGLRRGARMAFHRAICSRQAAPEPSS